jgi:hypothetical protein
LKDDAEASYRKDVEPSLRAIPESTNPEVIPREDRANGHGLSRNRGSVGDANIPMALSSEAQFVGQSLANHPEDVETIERLDHVAGIPAARTGKRQGLTFGREAGDVMVGEKDVTEIKHHSRLSQFDGLFVLDI